MSLQTDIIFVQALRSDDTLMEALPAGDVYNTTIALPEEQAINAPVPYIIVSYDGMTNNEETKDSQYEGSEDTVNISIEVTAQTRKQLAELAIRARNTVKNYFISASDYDENFELVPIDYRLTASGVNYDPDKPCYWQTLSYECDTNAD